jgi:hypothetical protein
LAVVRLFLSPYHNGSPRVVQSQGRTSGREVGELVDRSESPWDDPVGRPSHADKRRAWRRELLAEEIRAVLRPGVTEEEIRAIAARLLDLAA